MSTSLPVKPRSNGLSMHSDTSPSALMRTSARRFAAIHSTIGRQWGFPHGEINGITGNSNPGGLPGGLRCQSVGLQLAAQSALRNPYKFRSALLMPVCLFYDAEDRPA